MARQTDTTTDGPAAAVRRRFAAAAVLAAAVLAPARGAPAGGKLLAKLTAKTRKAISRNLARDLPGGRTFAIARVTRGGQAVPTPANMTLESRTGAFSWTPTPSQSGAYEITFLIEDAAGMQTRPALHITVAAPPVVTGINELRNLLRTWYAEGTAAGNIGDFYDNRDGGHSRLTLSVFPQVDSVEYTEEMKKRRLHWGAQLRMLFKHVTIGNSSTAAVMSRGGSNTRQCLCSARAAGVLYVQYRRNHLYVYPEHQDYDPGHNSRGRGYGDVLPANTPYLITSQGSSGSDRAFLRAAACTLAAFRPEVKRLLIRSGLLMPTLQMIFRYSNKGIQSDKAYLTGKAHPPVFDQQRIDPLKMATMAHDMTAETVPPIVQLAVVEEDRAVPGRDYAGTAEAEKLFNTPAAIARIARSTRRVRRMVVSAKGSADLRRRGLTYHWIVLQGDPEKIAIKPLNADKSVVELRIAYHRRRPIHDASPMESTRVDIGAFVHNGKYFSAPGFVTVFFLDNEARTYDPRGRILEVSYAHGDSRIGVHRYVGSLDDIKDYPALLKLAASNRADLAARLLRRQCSTAEAAALGQAAGELAANPKAAAEILARPRKALKASALVRIEDALNAVKNDLNFSFRNARSLAALHAKVADKKAAADKRRSEAFRKAVSELRELAKDWAKRPTARPFPGDLAPERGGLMGYQRNRIERANIAILQSVVYPDLLSWTWRENFVANQIVTPEAWRDVYRYAPDGRLIGWTRYRGNTKEPFTAAGALVVEKDNLGRARVAHSVRYIVSTTRYQRRFKQQPGDMVFHYTYASDEDPIGRIDRMEKR